MSETNLKSYEFESHVLDNIKLFDEVLAECGEPPLLENNKFSPFLDFPISSKYLTIELSSSNPNSLLMIIWFEGEGVRIDFDQINVTFDWSKEQILKTRDEIIEIIRNLFTGYILIENRGTARFVQVFDANGFFVDSFSYNNLFHMITGLHIFRHKNYRKLYLPLFSKKK